MVDIFTQSKRSEIMSHVKNKSTKPEEQFAKLLKINKIKYDQNVNYLPGNPDFVIFYAKLAIFIHGCFWHGHPNCNRAKLPQTNKTFWKEKIFKNTKRDAKVCRLLRKQGWHIMTIWQCRLRDQNRVIKRLKIMLNK